MSHVNWEYYSSLYDNVPQDDFEKRYKQAEIKLNTVTHMRASAFEHSYDEESATPFQRQVHEQILSTMCELVNAVHIHAISEMGTGITSVNNDGYSESYKITTAAEKEAQIISIIRSGLSGTGLAGAL